MSKKKARAEARATVANARGASKAKAIAKARNDKVKAAAAAAAAAKRGGPRPGGKKAGFGPGGPKQSAQNTKSKGKFNIGVKGNKNQRQQALQQPSKSQRQGGLKGGKKAKVVKDGNAARQVAPFEVITLGREIIKLSGGRCQ